MNTLFISVNPTVDQNVRTLCVDFSSFDPTDGIGFSVALQNPNGNTFDRAAVALNGNRWQDWPATTSPEDDTNYIKQTVLVALGFTEFIPPAPEPDPVLEG